MLRRLFYVSASLFLLALAYHLGATNAGAQAGGQVQGASIVASNVGPYRMRASCVVGQTFYVMLEDGSQQTYSYPLPSAQAVLATDPFGWNVLLADGEVLRASSVGWDHLANAFPGGATPARTESLGQLKARYR